jgi:hypothetical protein
MTLLGTLKVDISKTKPRQVFQNDKKQKLNNIRLFEYMGFQRPKTTIV